MREQLLDRPSGSGRHGRRLCARSVLGIRQASESDRLAWLKKAAFWRLKQDARSADWHKRRLSRADRTGERAKGGELEGENFSLRPSLLWRVASPIVALARRRPRQGRMVAPLILARFAPREGAIQPRDGSKYPPAKPEALECEPLKAAGKAACAAYTLMNPWLLGKRLNSLRSALGQLFHW
jgi:hypothetical protein